MVPWVVGAVALLAAGLVGVYFLAQTIFRVETKADTVLLEIDQKDAEVYVDGGKINVGRPGDRNTITVEAKEGKHLLRVTKVGFEAWTDDITFHANEAYRVKVSLKPVVVAKNDNKADKNPAKNDPATVKKSDPIPQPADPPRKKMKRNLLPKSR